MSMRHPLEDFLAPSHMMDASIRGSRVCIFSTVKGLTSERERVREAYTRLAPDAVALPISEESLGGLRAYRGEPVEMNTAEAIYAHHLSRFGAVHIPHPAYTEVLELADDDGIPVHAIDMDEETYTEVYLKCISGLAVVLSSFRERRLASWMPRAKDPFRFALEWDRAINASSGFKRLERMREKHMAERILALAGRCGVMLVLIEHERSHGVIEKVMATAEGSRRPV